MVEQPRGWPHGTVKASEDTSRDGDEGVASYSGKNLTRASVTTTVPPFRSQPIRAVKVRGAASEYSPTHDIPTHAAKAIPNSQQYQPRPMRHVHNSQPSDAAGAGEGRTIRFREEVLNGYGEDDISAAAVGLPPPMRGGSASSTSKGRAATTSTDLVPSAAPAPEMRVAAVQQSTWSSSALRCCTVELDTTPMDAKYQIREQDAATVAFRVLLEVFERLGTGDDKFSPAPRSPRRESEATIGIGACGVLVVEDSGEQSFLPLHFIKGFTLRDSVDFPGCGDVLIVAGSEDDSMKGLKVSGVPPMRLYSCLAPMVVARCIYVSLTEYADQEKEKRDRAAQEERDLAKERELALAKQQAAQAAQPTPLNAKSPSQRNTMSQSAPLAPLEPGVLDVARLATHVATNQVGFVAHHLASPFVAIYDFFRGGGE